MQVFVQDTVQPPVQDTVQPPVQDAVQPPVRAMMIVSPPKKEFATWDRSGVTDMSPFVEKAAAAAGELNCNESAFLFTEVLAKDAPSVRLISVKKIKYFFIRWFFYHSNLSGQALFAQRLQDPYLR